MIPLEIVSRLIPQEYPRTEFPVPANLRREDLDEPVRRFGMWSAYLRFELARQLQNEGHLRERVEASGFVGVGIIRASDWQGGGERRLRVVEGYSFGAMLFGGSLSPEELFQTSLPLEEGRLEVPVVETIATFTKHAFSRADGFTAAIFENQGDAFGITAGHVVDKFNPGQQVPIECSDCRSSAKLVRKAPGLIDAAIVAFPCGGPGYRFQGRIPTLRGAVESEPLLAHWGVTGKQSCSVMQSLSTPHQIISAAMPQHFLLDRFGIAGDSGSLVSGVEIGPNPPDLVGIYLGACDCEDRQGRSMRCGFGLDLSQAAAIFKIRDLKGDYK